MTDQWRKRFDGDRVYRDNHQDVVHNTSFNEVLIPVSDTLWAQHLASGDAETTPSSPKRPLNYNEAMAALDRYLVTKNGATYDSLTPSTRSLDITRANLALIGAVFENKNLESYKIALANELYQPSAPENIASDATHARTVVEDITAKIGAAKEIVLQSRNSLAHMLKNVQNAPHAERLLAAKNSDHLLKKFSARIDAIDIPVTDAVWRQHVADIESTLAHLSPQLRHDEKETLKARLLPREQNGHHLLRFDDAIRAYNSLLTGEGNSAQDQPEVTKLKNLTNTIASDTWSTGRAGEAILNLTEALITYTPALTTGKTYALVPNESSANQAVLKIVGAALDIQPPPTKKGR